MCYNKLNNNKLFCYGLHCILIILLEPFDWCIEFEILTYRAFIKRNEANKYENDISITKARHGPRSAYHRNLFKNWSKQTEKSKWASYFKYIKLWNHHKEYMRIQNNVTFYTIDRLIANRIQWSNRSINRNHLRTENMI